MTKTIDIAGKPSTCSDDCHVFVQRWMPWWQRQIHGGHAALLEIMPRDRYMQLIGPKSRNMVRKADKLYRYRPFLRNSWLEDIYAINTSKEIRAGGKMGGYYLVKPEPTLAMPERLCTKHFNTWQGAFDAHGDKLLGYCNLIILNQLAVVNTILGHGEAPAVINGLVAYMVDECRRTWRSVRWIHYLSITSSPEGLARFKLSVGFREVELK